MASLRAHTRFLRAILPLLVALHAGAGGAADLAGLIADRGQTSAAAEPESRPVSIRISWGGGPARSWQGGITAVEAAAGADAGGFAWRTLSSEPDAAALVHADGTTIHVHQPRPVVTDGVEITVANWRTGRLAVRLAATDAARAAVEFEVAVADILGAPVQRPLDDAGNRITLKPAPGEGLRVAAAAGPEGRFLTAALGEVRAPGERLRLRVDPLLPTALQGGHAADLRMRLRNARTGADIAEQSATLVPVSAAGSFTEFEPVIFEVALPATSGVFDVELQALERGSLRWSRTLAERTVQVAAVDASLAEPPSSEPWRKIYELDPGSPRLHERLRRLPGMALPAVPLPAMPRPPLAMPKLPGVPLPDVAALVPRLGGLLADGHSGVVSHPLGPMLRLPPAPTAGEPSWEGIVIAGVQPGMPLAVEIDYPADQDAVLGVAVLEADAAAAAVESRHAGGVEIRRPLATAPRLGVHRFVFWPTTKHPLVVIANPSTTSAALFGRVRVLAGPARLPVIDPPRPSGSFVASGPPRRSFALVEDPDLARNFGGAGRPLPGTGRSANDWTTHVDAVRHLADAVRSQAAAGGVVAVYADGAATWPSPLTRHAAAWDLAARVEGGEPAARDLLGLLARGFEAHGLALVPALSFDAPLADVEAALAAADCAPGMACIGGDGRPLVTPRGVVHYNVLDPRVQRAVESLLVEAAGRVRGSPAVEALAVILADDGWLHLPAVAAGLDDATFARFTATLPEPTDPQSGPERFAARRRLVEGPLRSAWVAWRCREVAAFHGRLAAAVAAIDGRWSLHVVPTTLFAARIAALAGGGGEVADDRLADLVRELGLDPTALPEAAAGRVVFGAPHVAGSAGSLRERVASTAANRAPAVAAAALAARRRGGVVVGRPLRLDLSAAVAQGPFGTATIAAPVVVRPLVDGSGPLAEALALGDAELLVDARLARGGLAGTAARRAFESLPAAACDRVLAVPQPALVRLERSAGVTRALVVNPLPVPMRAVLQLDALPSAIVDVVGGVALPAIGDGTVPVPLEPHGVRALLIDGGVAVKGARLEYPEEVGRAVAGRIDWLRRCRAAIETPVPLEVLDNPGFELGAADTPGKPAAAITGWEVVEARRGALALVSGAGEAGQPGRGLSFSSLHGLATLRSNPFAAPPTGRISVAAWLRVADGVQPPLRIALEGVQGDREYYRFAAIGGLTGGRPLTGSWAQFVLQVDDLPVEAIESLRVRFDLLGPGRVEIDEVRVFDLAFDESQRARISAAVSLLEHQLASGDVGGCLAGFDGYWSTFLEAHVGTAVVDAAERQRQDVQATTMPTDPQPVERQASGGILDRMRSWWQ